VSDTTPGWSVSPGAGTPHTASGRSCAYQPPPWRMRGRTLALWFRLADPDEARRHVPALLHMDRDPILRARFWDMEHDAVPTYTPESPIPTHAWTAFREAVVAFPVRHAGTEADYPTYMYADEFAYTAFGREVMGWPVRAGQVEVDAEPGSGPAPGMRVGARLVRHGRPVMQMELTLNGSHRAERLPRVPRWLASKVISDVAGPTAAVAQLVATGPEVVHRRDVWEAEGSLTFAESPTDELHHLAPREIVAAQYWTDVELTIGWGTVLEELGAHAWDG
jgi:acetoacetate decarboxylase